MKNKKISISISLDPKVLDIIGENFTNRSKFLENCVIEELCKDPDFKEELKNKKIILWENLMDIGLMKNVKKKH